MGLFGNNKKEVIGYCIGSPKIAFFPFTITAPFFIHLLNSELDALPTFFPSLV